jgi:putative FmdB family regulatory protein
MPTYEYKCDACGEEFEKFQSIMAPPIKTCPKCHKNKVRRLISAGAGIVFKGSGFYITDYRSEAYKEKAKSESGESKPEAKKDAKGADAKSPSGSGETSAAPATPAPSPKKEPKASKSARK